MKPSFQSVIDNQKIADHRLHHDKMTRSEPEIAHYHRVLQPVPASDASLPRLPLVRYRDDETRHYVLIGEIAQIPGTVLLFEPATSLVSSGFSDQLDLVPGSVGDDSTES